MLSQVGSVTTNGIQQKSDFRDTTFTAFADMPVWPNLLTPSASPPGTFPAFSGIRVFDRDYQQPAHLQLQRRVRARAGAEHGRLRRRHGGEERPPDAVPELQRARHGRGGGAAGDARHDHLYAATTRSSRSSATCSSPTAAATASIAARRSACASASRSSYQLEANYVLSKDEDDDSNERDPFTDRSFNFYDLEPGLRAVGSRHPPQVQLLHLRRAAAAVPGQRPHAGADGAADHLVAAGAERHRSRPQLGSQGQRVLLARLAAAARVPRRREHADHSRASRCSTRSTTRTTSIR